MVCSDGLRHSTSSASAWRLCSLQPDDLEQPLVGSKAGAKHTHALGCLSIFSTVPHHIRSVSVNLSSRNYLHQGNICNAIDMDKVIQLGRYLA